MNELPHIQSVINALGWTLIHFLWQGLGIACGYWLLLRLSRPENSLLRYWAGMAGFLLAVIVPAGTFLYYWLPDAAPVIGVALPVSMVPVPGNVSLTLSQLLQLVLEPAIPAVVLLWAAGVVFLSLRAAIGWYGAHRLIRFETKEAAEPLQQLVQHLINQLGISQAVRVLESTRVVVPTVIGWIKPVILLPAAVIARMPGDQLEMVIAHELGHIKRYDYLFNLLQLVIETLFFYHPAIRWMSGQVRQEREHCCDDLVVGHCKQPVLYARALAQLEVLREPLPAVAMAASGGDLVHRVRRIVQREVPGNHSGFAQLGVILGVALMVSMGAHQGLQMRQQFPENASSGISKINTMPGQDAVDRTSWIKGIAAYPQLTLKRVAEMNAANRKLQQTLASSSETAREPMQTDLTVFADVPAGLQTSSNRPTDTDTAGSPGQRHELFAAPATGSGAYVDESLLMAGVYSPSLSKASEQDNWTSDDKAQVAVAAERTVAPVYPFKARRKHINGYVQLEFSINGDGKPRDIEVVKAQPEDMFEKSAISALEQWIFRVGEEHSQNRRLLQVFDFGMEDEGPVLAKRERRCEIAGSRICGTQRYNEKNKMD